MGRILFFERQLFVAQIRANIGGSSEFFKNVKNTLCLIMVDDFE